MKIQNSMALMCGLFLAGGPLSAQEVHPVVIQVVYEVFSLSQSDAAESQRESLTDREMYAKMLTGLEDGKVKQEKLQAIRTRSGQRSQSDHVSEFIYATEYEPAELPNSVGVAVNSPALIEEKPTGEQVIEALKAGPGWAEGTFPVTPSTGTAFDTQILGDLLEVEAMTGIGKPDVISLRLAVNHVELAGYEAWGMGVSEAKMPRFSSKKIHSGVIVRSGVPTLVGTISPSKEDQVKEGEVRVWFAFVTTTIVEVKD